MGARCAPTPASQRVVWQPGRVEVETNQGSFSARQAIVTLPLGVLQRGSVVFDPAPGEILEQARRLHMGQASRITLLLRERFWETLPPQPELSQLSFLFTRGMVPSVWWTTHPMPSTTLTGWTGGPRSAQLLGLSAEAVGEPGVRPARRGLPSGCGVCARADAGLLHA